LLQRVDAHLERDDVDDHAHGSQGGVHQHAQLEAVDPAPLDLGLEPGSVRLDSPVSQAGGPAGNAGD